MKDDRLEIKQPIVIVGIGGAGSKLAIISSKLLGCKCVLISNDVEDLDNNCITVFINSNSWINPSSYKLRSFAQSAAETIKSAVEGFQTIIVIANLAGRAGTAMAPVVCREGRLSSANTLISAAIMPFKYEKDRIFQAGISLKRLRGLSDATIVIDNDALLNNNPELSTEECYEITNRALCEIIASFSKHHICPNLNLLCTSRIDTGSAESSIKDSIGMLYQNGDPTTIKRAMLHVMGSGKIPIGSLNSIVDNLQGIFKDHDLTEVSMSSASSDNVRVHLMAAVGDKTRFDKYDPIAEIIPKENVLDWEDMDSSPDIEIMIPNLE
jgi:cell division protein FtsZ